MHSVQNPVDNRCRQSIRNVTWDTSDRFGTSPSGRQLNLRSAEPPGQGHFCDEGRGHRGSAVIHTHLWTTLWKDEDGSVDSHVDTDVDTPSVHVSAGGCT